MNRSDQIWFKFNSFAEWERIEGGLKQIEVGKVGVFGVNRHDHIYYRIGTVGDSRSSGNDWQRLDGSLKHISVGSKSVWGVNNKDDIYEMQNISFDIDGKINFKWRKVEGKLKNISVYSGSIWGVNSADYIYFKKTARNGFNSYTMTQFTLRN